MIVRSLPGVVCPLRARRSDHHRASCPTSAPRLAILSSVAAISLSRSWRTCIYTRAGREPCVCQRPRPRLREVAPSELAAIYATNTNPLSAAQGVSTRPDVRLSQDDQLGKDDRPSARFGLGRALHKLPELMDGLNDPHAAIRQVQIPASESCQLAPSQIAEGSEQDESPVPRAIASARR